MLTGLFFLAKILSMGLAAFVCFKKGSNPFSEAASYAIITVFMLLSFVHQISFIAGMPILCSGLEIVLFLASIGVIFRHRSGFFDMAVTVKTFGSASPVSFSFFGLCLVYMSFHSMLPAPVQFQADLYPLAIYEKNDFFSLMLSPDIPPLLPLNHAFVLHTSIQGQTASGIGLLCFLAYLSTGFSTYALARRYAWQNTAFTTAILVMTMPMLVNQAIAPNTRIISVSVALFCLLAMYRSCELATLTDLVLLILGLFFCISETVASLIFVPILFALSCVVLFRRHGISAWKNILTRGRYTPWVIVPVIIFSQSWLLLSNYVYKKSWPGIFSDTGFNPDGIQGALANSVRYLFESFNSAFPLDLFSATAIQWSMAEKIEAFFNFSVQPFLGDNGAAQAFALAGRPNGLVSFGPAGFFLVLPALVYALRKGPRRLKAVATAFFLYFCLTALILAWAPGNEIFFEFFYVCSGFSIAFFLPPWRFTKTNKKVLQAAGFFVLILTLWAGM